MNGMLSALLFRATTLKICPVLKASLAAGQWNASFCQLGLFSLFYISFWWLLGRRSESPRGPCISVCPRSSDCQGLKRGKIGSFLVGLGTVRTGRETLSYGGGKELKWWPGKNESQGMNSETDLPISREEGAVNQVSWGCAAAAAPAAAAAIAAALARAKLTLPGLRALLGRTSASILHTGPYNKSLVWGWTGRGRHAKCLLNSESVIFQFLNRQHF